MPTFTDTEEEERTEMNLDEKEGKEEQTALLLTLMFQILLC